MAVDLVIPSPTEQPQQQQEISSEAALRYFGQLSPSKMGDEVRRWQLDPEELLFRIERFLRRQVYSPKTKSYVSIKGVEPMANELGIQTILAYLTGLLDPRSITLSNFDEDSVNRLARQSKEALRDFIVSEYAELGIQSCYIPLIVCFCDSMVYGVLRRAYMGGERRSQQATHHTLEQVRSFEDGGRAKVGEKKGFLFK